MLPGNDYFFRIDDPESDGLHRVIWYGSLDIETFKAFRRLTGDVPAPFWSKSHAGATPREMIQSQFPYKPRMTGPLRLRHRRTMADWLTPDTWPLLSAVFAGHAVDLYYAHFYVVPSQGSPSPEQLPHSFVYGPRDFAEWCRAADELGFIGIATNEGYSPYLIVLSSQASQRALDEGSPIISNPPEWLSTFFG